MIVAPLIALLNAAALGIGRRRQETFCRGVDLPRSEAGSSTHTRPFRLNRQPVFSTRYAACCRTMMTLLAWQFVFCRCLAGARKNLLGL